MLVLVFLFDGLMCLGGPLDDGINLNQWHVLLRWEG
jgi:hypothetical protein